MATKSSKGTSSSVSSEKRSASAPGTGASGHEAGPNTDQIARRAYEIFLARGGQHGRDADDWLQAERELRLGRQ
jgi:hypothetical protein